MEDYPKEEQTGPPKDDEEYCVAIYPLGLMPGMIITSEQVRKAAEAEERQKNRNNKPPKPPSRPNIPLGRTALSNSY